MSAGPTGQGHRRDELRAFLRTRRARLTPADVGLVAGPRRRTPGLRREEVAVLAGVGVSWYTWLEQGRDITVSVGVLDAISGALRLTGPERAHLHALTGLHPPPADEPRQGGVAPEMDRLLHAWMPRPAMLQDRYWNLVAFNDATRRLFGFGDTDHNCLVTFFTNARYRDAYVHWETVAPDIVAAFRADAAGAPDDPGFTSVIDRLSAVSPEFVALWQRHDVGLHLPAVKVVRHPDVGDLVFDKTTLGVTDRPGWHLVLYDPRPETGTDERLARLVDRQPRSPSVSPASSSR